MTAGRHPRSAGVLVWRRVGESIEVLLAHPGGPFFAKKDDGAWSIPKGEYSLDESPLEAARRELEEETGLVATGELAVLGEVRQKSGKVVTAFAWGSDFDPARLRSNTFSLEWPPRSGKHIDVPEIDRVAWFSLVDAQLKMIEAQQPLLERLRTLLGF